jgi:hypothetical protein
MAERRTFLVECYSPGIERASAAEAGRRARAAVAVLRRPDRPIEYLGALLVAGDEVVFHAFRATDPKLVDQVSRQAGLLFERIVESVTIDGAEIAEGLSGLLAELTPDSNEMAAG